MLNYDKIQKKNLEKVLSVQQGVDDVEKLSFSSVLQRKWETTY